MLFRTMKALSRKPALYFGCEFSENEELGWGNNPCIRKRKELRVRKMIEE